jgi:PKD repeat protein
LGLNTSKIWYFGDGDSSLSDTAYHSCQQAGKYTVTLIETNTYGCKDTATKQVIVHPSPVADFSINNPAQCFNEQNFVMSDESSVTGDSITQRIWINGKIQCEMQIRSAK